MAREEKERREVIRIERQGERGELRGGKRQKDRQKIKLTEKQKEGERSRISNVIRKRVLMHRARERETEVEEERGKE